jgi:hypothetical protein
MRLLFPVRATRLKPNAAVAGNTPALAENIVGFAGINPGIVMAALRSWWNFTVIVALPGAMMFQSKACLTNQI